MKNLTLISLLSISNISFGESSSMIPLFEMPSIVYYKPEKISSLGNQFGDLHHLEMKENLYGKQ